MGKGKSLARFRDEARKCVLLCANCHGEVESGLVPSPPAGAQYPSASYLRRYGQPHPTTRGSTLPAGDVEREG
jgi:hypothetical protein